jgi:pimeloyl-ACP methyl ester carboxylesterase
VDGRVELGRGRAAPAARALPRDRAGEPAAGVALDAAYLASVLEALTGPIVLVGHSYGGAVITNAAAGCPSVKALVYVAGLAPDEGEDTLGLVGRFSGSEIVPPDAPGATLTARPFLSPGGQRGTDLYISVDRFARIFAADLPADSASAMAVTQRPIAASALEERSGPAAWRGLPSWALVASRDRAIGAANQRYLAHRAHSTIVEVEASHAAPVSAPEAVTGLILAAAGAVARSEAQQEERT